MHQMKASYVFSTEQLIQCDKTNFGCNGGTTDAAFNYLIKTGGIETESSYPYTSYYGATGTCSADPTKYIPVKIQSIYVIIPAYGESAMATYVGYTGPLSVCLDGSTWSTYTSGIMSGASCGTTPNHCVQIVGLDQTAAAPYWKVRNQWGTGWGESGYIQLQYGVNACDITFFPTYLILA